MRPATAGDGAAVAENAAAHGARTPTALRAQASGRLGDPRLHEISGLAASHRHADRYWLHNDSGDGPFLYAIDAKGALAGTLQIDGVLALDWEDIASFKRDGKSWLLVADSGDNLGMRGEYTLIAVEEPELPADNAVVHAAPAWQLHYRYADAPHDTEAMAVDATRGDVFLLPKFGEPLRVFRIALQPGDDRAQIAQPWATLTAAEQAAPADEKSAGPKFRPTGLDLAADGRYAAVLGYRSVWLYARGANEDWRAAFAHAPQRVAVVPPLHQPEAIGFSADGGALWVTGEGQAQPLLRVELPRR
jgi:hypothetical protein